MDDINYTDVILHTDERRWKKFYVNAIKLKP